MSADNGKKDSFQNEISENDISGKKFEDLTPEEMQKIQGSGDISPEDIGDITDLIFSRAPYNCK